jgi:putative oxidoreductase
MDTGAFASAPRNVFATVGRVMFALTFVMGGLLHVTGPQYAAGQVPRIFGAPIFWVYVTGIAQLAFALSILLRRYDRLASLLLFLMMCIFIATIHVPRAAAGDFMGVISIMRDFGYAAAALIYAGAMAVDVRFAFSSVAPAGHRNGGSS